MRKVFLAALLLLGAATAHAQQTYQVRIKWALPTTCEDGRAVAVGCPLTGLNLYSRNSATQAVLSLLTALAPTATESVRTLPPGTYCYSLTAVTGGVLNAGAISGGTESVRPPEVCATVPVAEPPPPPGVPNPPSSITIEVVVGVPFGPVFNQGTKGQRTDTLAGLIPTGKPCLGASVGTYRGQQYKQVSRNDVRFAVGVKPQDAVVAACS